MNHLDIAEEAFSMLESTIKTLLHEKAQREDMHIVVMDPTKKPWESSFEDAILFEKSLTDKTGWENPYDVVAREKARQSWRDGYDNVKKHLLAPATLSSGDLAFYGSFEYGGVVVAASGAEFWYDSLISGWIAITIHQLAQGYYNRFKQDHPKDRYLP